jgi:SAM-dependent methyltransferase
MLFFKRARRAEHPDDHAEAGNIEGQRLVRAYFRLSLSAWSEIYDGKELYSKIYVKRMDAVLEILDRLPLPPHSRILDIGCGPGVMTLALAQRGYRVCAVDLVVDMAEATARLTAGAGIGSGVTMSVGDVHHLPFSADTFDLVLALGVTEWLPALRRPVMEIARVLKPGGFAVVSTDNRWTLHTIIDPLLNPILTPVKRTLRNLLHRGGLGTSCARPRTYSMREFDVAVCEAGLKKLVGTTLGFGPLSFFRRPIMSDSVGLSIHHVLQRLADRGLPIVRSAGHVYLVLATKMLQASASKC